MKMEYVGAKESVNGETKIVRYRLSIIGDHNGKNYTVIMKNPSKSVKTLLDVELTGENKSVEKTVDYSDGTFDITTKNAISLIKSIDVNFGKIHLLNLIPLFSPSKNDANVVLPEKVSNDNVAEIKNCLEESELIVCCWGVLDGLANIENEYKKLSVVLNSSYRDRIYQVVPQIKKLSGANRDVWHPQVWHFPESNISDSDLIKEYAENEGVALNP